MRSVQAIQARLVTLCQQVLALGVVLAVLTPASGVVSLDVVGEVPGQAPGLTTSPAELMAATVPTKAVAPQVTEVPLTTETGSAEALSGRTVQGRSVTSTTVRSKPQPISGFGAVGVTWESSESLTEDQITVRVRTRTDDAWSDWSDLEYHAEHGPDPDSAEGRAARPGTEPMFVGEVDEVQVAADTAGTTLPEDLSLALVTPGEAKATQTEAPAEAGASYAEQADREGETSGGLELRAARRTVAQPTVFSRAQWGADERIREQSRPDYGTIKAGFVHHTVNANNYSEAEVPGIIRSIYAYHVRSRGWRDIGYNFLVDRFGRIWEGRYGGIDRPVIGAHTLGYNHESFAMSAIGNFETVRPSDVMLRAYGQLFAWKLSLHGVNPASMSQSVGRSTFAAISGHRDAGSTACPGRYLYRKLSTIRTYAAEAANAPTAPTGPTPVEVTAPTLATSLAGTPHPDLVARRASDGRAFVLPTGGLTSFNSRRVIGKRGWQRRGDVLVSPDISGDGVPDLVTVNRNGQLNVRPGNGRGRFGKTSRKIRWTRGYSVFAAVGDINGNNRGDLVARRKGRLVVLSTTAKGGFRRKVLDKGFGRYIQLVGPGDVTGDGRPDLLGRTRSRVYLFPGGHNSFGKRQAVAGAWGGYDRLAGGGDYTGDGRPDLVARADNGRIHVLPGRGDGTFGAARGPATNIKSLRFLSGAGSLTGGPGPDLVGVAGRKLVVIGNRDTTDLGQPIDTGVSFAGMNLVLNAGDVNRDGHGDVLTRDGSGQLWLFRGNGQGQLAAGVVLGAGWGAIDGLAAVGDVTGDGLPDLMGTPAGGALTVWRGTGSSFAAGAPVAGRVPVRGGLPADLSPYDWVVLVSDMQLRGAGDYIVRERGTGRLLIFNGRSKGTSRPRVLGDGLEGFDLAG